MPTDTQLTGGTMPFVVSEQTFKARPLTDRDYAELDEYVRAHIINTARKVAANLSEKERRELLAAAVLAATGLRWTSEEGAKVLNTLEGAAYLSWLMVKHSHKNVPFNAFYEVFSQDSFVESNLIELDRVWATLNLPEEDEDEDSTSDSSGKTEGN